MNTPSTRKARTIRRAVQGGSLALLTSTTLSGCATVGMHMRYGTLEAKTEMSQSVFLDVTNELPRTVYVSETRTVGEGISVAASMQSSLRAAGYAVVDNPAEATYVIQMNHRQIVQHELGDGRDIDDAIGNAFAAGGAAALGAAVLGAEGAAGELGLAVGVAAFLLDARTKHLAHTLTTDIRVTENRCGPNGTDTREHDTQIVAAASKVNLDRAQAMPMLVGEVVSAITGLMPTG